MGSNTSRVASKAVSRATASPQSTAVSVDALASLPANSAVRRDAVDGAALQEQRLAQEAGGLPLEELNSKDESLVALMQQTMTTTAEGKIHFREHVLPLNDNTFTSELVSKVCIHVCKNDYIARVFTSKLCFVTKLHTLNLAQRGTDAPAAPGGTRKIV